MISIIVPVYNAGNGLHYCIDSILKQSYNDFELILVDDGSTDGSGNVCNDYAINDKRIIVVHLKNGGVSKARNAGIKLAKGEFICFIDSDDFVAIDYLEKLYITSQQYPDYDSIWCGFQTTNDYNNTNGKCHLVNKNERLSGFDIQHIMDLHYDWLSQMPWNKLFNSSIVNKNNIVFPEDMTLGEDLIFNLRYLDKTNGRIMVINEPLYYYLQADEDSLDNKYYPDLFEKYKRINKEILYYITQWKCGDKQIKQYYNTCFFSYEKVLRNTYNKKSIIKHKGQYNKQIMKSEEFVDALSKSTCFIHPLYRFAYSKKLNVLFRILDIISGVSS